MQTQSELPVLSDLLPAPARQRRTSGLVSTPTCATCFLLVHVPTLVLHRRETTAWDVRSGRYLADHIPGALLVELPAVEFGSSLGDQDTLFAALESFLDDVAQGKQSAEPDRVLATVLFTDIVGVDRTGRGARRPRLAQARRASPRSGSNTTRPLPWQGVGHGRRRVLRLLRWTRARNYLCSRDRRDHS